MENQVKTRIEWAKEKLNDKDLVKFILNTCELSKGILFLESSNFRHAMLGAFPFDETPEGRNYWFDLVDKLDA